MNIGIIIPDRGDRPEFLANCIRMMECQTLECNKIRLVIGPYQVAVGEKVDLVNRYRYGYQLMSELDVDLIAFIENDDWYSPTYLEEMVGVWAREGEPDLLGTSYTYYFHLKLWKYFKMNHPMRSVMMSTLMKPRLKFDWPLDHDPFLDTFLWKQDCLKRHIHTPEKVITIGMKHGVGRCAGGSHTKSFHRYENENNGFLESIVDVDSLDFYKNLKL